MNNLVKILIIIPAYNAADYIMACITALQHQTFPREQYEIIVVDDQSTDNTAQIVQETGVILNFGYSDTCLVAALGACQEAWHFTAHGRPIDKSGENIVKVKGFKLMG